MVITYLRNCRCASADCTGLINEKSSGPTSMRSRLVEKHQHCCQATPVELRQQEVGQPKDQTSNRLLVTVIQSLDKRVRQVRPLISFQFLTNTNYIDTKHSTGSASYETNTWAKANIEVNHLITNVTN